MPDSPYFLAEYTQGIQTFKNGVTIPPPGVTLPPQTPNNTLPLISHKQTLVRAYLHVQDIADPKLGQRIFGGDLGYYAPDGQFKRVASLNGPIMAKRAFQVSRGNINDTLNFLIPAEDCKGRIDGAITINDNFSQDGLAYLIRLEFLDVPLVDIHSVMIHYTGPDFFGNAVSATPNAWDLLKSLDYVLRSYPINGFNFDGCEVLDWDVSLEQGQTAPQAVEQSWNDVFDKLKDMQSNSDSNSIYVGVLPDEATCASTCGLGRDDVAALFRAGATDSAAHEIGHALGRPHTPCANKAKDEDDDYPDYFGLPRGTISEFGVDLQLLAAPGAPDPIFDPASACDFMSYCRPRWMSPYTFLKILERVQDRGTQYLSAKIPLPMGKPQEYQFVAFRIQQTVKGEEVEIVNEFSIPKRMPPPPPLRSFVKVDLVDGRGRILASIECGDDSQCAAPGRGSKRYTAWFPADQSIARLRIRSGERVIHDAPVAKSAPKIKSPSLRQVKRDGKNFCQLSWEAEGAQAKSPALYSVRFSADGKKWRSLITGSRETKLVFSTDLLPGGKHCAIQILASSGLRTSATTLENIEIDVKPMQAYIVSPQPDQSYRSDQQIYFSGAGFSPNEGAPPPEAVSWTTPSRGLIGRGYQVLAGGFPAGVHTVTMHVSCEHGEEACASVEIRVSEEPCDRGRSDSDITGVISELGRGVVIQDGGSTNRQENLVLQSAARRAAASVSDEGCSCREQGSEKEPAK